MVSLKSIEQQLKEVGCNFKFWGRPEIVELSKIIMPDEKIAQIVNGQYEGGFAILCATDQRVLLVDKKPLYLTIEDVRFEMISDVNFNSRLLDPTIQIMTGVKTLQFTAHSSARLRLIFSHVQQRITEVRQRHSQAQQVEEQIVEELRHHPVALPHQIAPAMQRLATDHQTPAPFNGFRHQVALQIAHYLGPRAVVFSQHPPTLSRYKLPLTRRPYRQTT